MMGIVYDPLPLSTTGPVVIVPTSKIEISCSSGSKFIAIFVSRRDCHNSDALFIETGAARHGGDVDLQWVDSDFDIKKRP